MITTLATLILAWGLMAHGVPGCSIAITVAGEDGLPVQYASAKLREYDTLRESWSGRADGAGHLSIDIPTGDPSVLDLFMPGFAITSTRLECDSKTTRKEIVLTEVTMPVANTQFEREPDGYIDRAVGVCATKVNNSTIELSDGTRMMADIADPIATRWGRVPQGKFCANASFHWNEDQSLGSFRITNVWW